MTVNRAFKQKVRARMKETGEKYTEARRKILAQEAAREIEETLRSVASEYRQPEGR